LSLALLDVYRSLVQLDHAIASEVELTTRYVENWVNATNYLIAYARKELRGCR
jgi:hypothetical protein